MASKQDYSREVVRQYLLTNVDEMLKNSTLYSLIVEQMSANYDGDKFVNKKGYDQINEVTGVRKEVKNTNSPLCTGEYRIQSFVKKLDSFDILKIVDSHSNRVFEIPHDVVFSEANVYKSGELRWSSSYGKSDKRKPVNTNLLLKYEVK